MATVAQLEILVNANTGNTKNELDGIDRSVQGIGKGLSKASPMFLGVAAAGAGMFVHAISGAVEFESIMTDLQIATGTTDENMADLTATVMSLGEAFPFSAQEVGQLMTELAKLGFSGKDLESLTSSALSLSTALGTDLVPTGEAVAKIMNSLGLEASSAGELTEQLFKVLAAGSLDLETFMSAWKNMGASVKQAGLDFVSAAAFLTILTDAGISAETAGNALARLFNALMNPSEKLKTMLSDLGITFMDLEGNLLPVKDIIFNIMDAWATMTNAEKLDLAELIGGKQYMNELMTLFDKGRAAFDKFMENYNKAMGLQDAVAKKMKSAKAMWDTFMEAVNNASLVIGTMLLPAFKSVLGAVTPLISAIKGVNPTLLKVVIGIVGIVTAIAGLAGAIGMIIALWPMFAAGFAVLTSPITLIVLAIIALVAGLVLLYKKWKPFRNLVNGVAGAIKDFGQALSKYAIKYLNQLGTVAQKAATVVGGALVAGFSAARAVVSAVSGFVMNLVDAFMNFVRTSALVQAGISLVTGIIGAYVGYLMNLWDAVMIVVDAFGEGGLVGALKALPEAFGAVISAMLGFAGDLLDAFLSVDWASAASEVIGWIIAGISGGAGAASGIWNWLTESLSNAFSTMSGLVATGISLAWDAITSINWSDYIPDFAWDAFVTAVDLAKKVGSFAWDTFVTAVDLAKRVGAFAWGAFVVAVNLAQRVGAFAWDVFVKGVDIAKKVGAFAWTMFIKGVDLVAKVGDFAWSAFVVAVNLAQKVGAFVWSSFVTAVDLAARVGAFAWSAFVVAVNLAQKVGSFAWGAFVTAVDLAKKVGNFVWSAFVGAVDLASKVGAFAWSMFVTAVDLAAKVGAFAWGAFVTGVDLAQKVVDLVWDGFITKIDLGSRVPELSWDSFITSVDLRAFVRALNSWNPFIASINLLDYVVDLLWDTYVTSLDWGELAAKINWPDFIDKLEWPSKTDILNAMVPFFNPFGGSAPPLPDTKITYPEPMGGDYGFGDNQQFGGNTVPPKPSGSSMKPFAAQKIPPLDTVAFDVSALAWSTGIKLTATNAMLAFKTSVSTGTRDAQTSFSTFSTTIGTTMDSMRTRINTSITESMNALKMQVTTGTMTARTTFTTFTTGVQTSMNTLRSNVTTAITSAMTALRTQVSTGTTAARTSFTTFASSTQATLTSWGSSARSTITSAMNGVRSAIQSGMTAAAGVIRSGVSTWSSAVSSGAGAMRSAGVSVGQAAGQGVAAGMNSALGSVRASANALIAEVDRAMRAKAQISSPSKMTAYFGRMIGEGLVDGMGAMMWDVSRAGANLSNAALVAPNASFGMTQTGNALQGGHVTTVYVTNNYTVDVSDLEELNQAVDFVSGLDRERQLLTF